MLYTIRLRSRWRSHLNCVDWSFVDGPRWRGDKVRGGAIIVGHMLVVIDVFGDDQH